MFFDALSKIIIIAVLQLLSQVQLFVNPWTAVWQASLSFTVSQSLLKLMSTESLIPSNHLILCLPLLFLLSIFPSIKVFSSELALPIRWSNYWSFSFSISPSTEDSGLVFFRIDWFDLFAVQGALGSLLQHHNSKVSKASKVLSLLYVPNLTFIYDYWKNHSFTIWTFVSKVKSLLFNMLSRLVIAFLPRSKCLNFIAAVTKCSDFGAQENKTCHFKINK